MKIWMKIWISWLVVEVYPSEKYDGLSSSVGMITSFPTEWKVIKMFQSTNQNKTWLK